MLSMAVRGNNKYFYISMLISIILLFAGVSDIWPDAIPGIVLYLMAVGGNTIAVFGIVFPLLACIPVLTEFVSELESGFCVYKIQKMNRGKYYRKSFWMYVLKGGCILSLPQIIFGVFCIFLKRGYSGMPIYIDIAVLPELAVSAPFLYMCMIAANTFLCGCICASLGMGIFMFLKNKYVAFCVPFLYYLFSGMALIRWMPNLSLTLLYDINTGGTDRIAMRYLYAGILFVIGGILFRMGCQKEET